jgi:hypothetical protein
MDMNINETWNDQAVIQFNNPCTALGKGGANGNNAAFGNGNVQGLKASPAEHGPAGQNHHIGVSPLRFFGMKFYTKTAPLSSPLLRREVTFHAFYQEKTAQEAGSASNL